MTDIDACPKCKKMAGFVWHWSADMEVGDGYAECKGCQAKL